jgi:hypothetical protein
MRVGAAPAAGSDMRGRAALELLLLLDLGFLLVHVLGGVLEAQQRGHGLQQMVLASADAAPFGLLAPGQLAGAALLLALAAARGRNAATALAALAAAVLASADLLAVLPRFAVAVARGLAPHVIGPPAILAGKLLAGAALALVAALLVLPAARGSPLPERGLARALICTIALLAAVDMLVLASGLRFDLPEEALETALTAWPLSAAIECPAMSRGGTKMRSFRLDCRLVAWIGLRHSVRGQKEVSQRD